METDPAYLPQVKLLDHGYIRLIDHMGGDINIVRAARVSYDAAWRAGDDTGSDDRLIRSMMARGHTSPFEAVTATFEVFAPIFVFRQWHRHRTMSYNELSARYRELPEVYYLPSLENVTSQHPTEKQMRSVKQIADASRAIDIIAEQSALAFRRYKELLEMGVARELARSVLPVNTYSHMFVTANLLNWFRFFKQRCDGHAQYEIRVYAQAALSLLESVAPVAVAAFREHEAF